MAYAVRYTAIWNNEGKTGTLYIDQNNYVGAIDTLTLVSDAITITKQLEGWESHIFGDVCEFNIFNDRSNYFTLSDLMKATEKKYRIRVVEVNGLVTTLLFSGYINTEAVVQKYIKYATIHLVASSFISKLENVYPDSFDNIANVTFIDIVNEILLQAGSTYNIRVSSFLLSNGGTYVTGKSFMNRNGVSTEIFWKNNVDRVSSQEILESILKTFQCYMYFWDGYWYIESFDVLFNTDRFYVEYASGVSYSPSDDGFDSVYVEYVEYDLHDLVFLETSQQQTVTPGNRTVEIRIKQEPYYNAVVNDFRSVVKVGHNYLDDSINPTQPLRSYWTAYQPIGDTSMVWTGQGEPFKTMVNSIKRTRTFTPVPNSDNWANYQSGNKKYRYEGLTSRFLVTNDGVAELSIKWKYGTQNPLLPFTLNAPEPMHIRFTWFLWVYDLDNTFIGSVYWDEDDSLWRFDTANTGNFTNVSTSEINKQTYIVDVSVNIPLSEIKNYAAPGDVFILGTYYMVFKLATEAVCKDKDDTKNRVEEVVYYGDIQISASIETFNENVITGKTNTDFLSKTEVEIDIADVPNYNYKNGIAEGANLDILTVNWRRNELYDRKIVDYILIDKFRTGDVSRERITGRVESATLLRPFMMYIDTLHANTQFLLTGIIHDVTKDMYEITLEEYDNLTTITLNEV